MKLIVQGAFLAIFFVSVAFADQGLNETIEMKTKTLSVPKIIRNGQLNESIGIETLSDIVSPVLMRDDFVPVRKSVTLGIIESCHCVRFKVFRIAGTDSQKPFEISTETVSVSSPESKVVDVSFELRSDEKLYLTVEVPGLLQSGAHVEWLSEKEAKKIVIQSKRESSCAARAKLWADWASCPQMTNKNTPSAK